jgi:NCAIR mutase (PurE)-related protein
MDRERLAEILNRYKEGGTDLPGAMEELKDFPTSDLGFAQLDTHRSLRQGYPEVVYCAGKTPQRLEAIVADILKRGSKLLATRATAEHFEQVRKLSEALVFDAESRTIRLAGGPGPDPLSTPVAVVTAGTSDIPVAEEAAITAEVFGSRVVRIYDVGVAGIHRLLFRLPEIRKASVVIAIAGMEGALASVVGGLVDVPVIGVPTSVGYGAHFAGLAPLLAMLNSCAAGVGVVNIDNGFGAGYLASLISRGASKG